MTDPSPATSPAAEPAPASPHVLRMWLLRALGLLVVLMAVTAGILYPQFQEADIPALAEYPLADGTILQLRGVTSGPDNRFTMFHSFPSEGLLRRIAGELAPEVTIEAREPEDLSIWVSLRDPATDQSLDTKDLRYAVLVDDRDWPHYIHRGSRIAVEGPRKRRVARVMGVGSPNVNLDGTVTPHLVRALVPEDYVAYSHEFSLEKLPAQSATLQVYGKDLELLCEVPVTIPEDPQPSPQLPPGPKLPVTQESQGLKVTLEDLKYDPLSTPVPGLRRYRLLPQFAIAGGDEVARAWQPAAEWELRRVDDRGRRINESWSTHPTTVPSWTIAFDVPPSFESVPRPEQRWAVPVQVPAGGTVEELKHEHKLEDVHIRLLKLFGRGEYEFSLPARDGDGELAIDPYGVTRFAQLRGVREGDVFNCKVRTPRPALLISVRSPGEAHIATSGITGESVPFELEKFRHHAPNGLYYCISLNLAEAFYSEMIVGFVALPTASFEFTFQPPPWPDDGK